MPLTPEVLATQGEVVAWLGSLDISFAPDEDPWFTVDGAESPRQIGSALDLPDADDPVGALYEAVAASDAIVRATDGSPFTTLFNRFSIDNNPMLRDAAE